MLTEINLKNYKGFKEGKLEIKPITILLGANSVGKSSLIQLFLLLQETALSENYNSALKLHGGLFSLGEGINLFRNKDKSNSLEFDIRFKESSLNEIIKRDYYLRYVEELINCCLLVLRSMEDLNSTNLFKNIIKNSTKKNNFNYNTNFFKNKNFDRQNIIDLINSTAELISTNKNKESLKNLTHSRLLIYSNNIIRSLINDKDELVHIYDFLKTLTEIQNIENVRLTYTFNYEDENLRIKTFNLFIGEELISKINFKDKNTNFSLESDIFNFNLLKNKSNNNLKKYFSTSKTVFSFVENIDRVDYNGNPFYLYYINLISDVINQVENSFTTQKINYVSPLRAHPKRYYFLDKANANAFLDTLDGEAIAEILKRNSDLRNNVNSWFKKFNLHIDIGQIRDVIHQIVVKQNSLDLDITDVGFGVSQVLPVIIQGFLSKDKSITLIEQPEIHLHPTMQADLADLFIDIVSRKNKNADNKYLLIETHSEYLLKRLRRRISEGRIKNEHVAIYCIEHSTNDNCAIIRKLLIADKGGFDWPKDFYTGDLADDVTEFLNNQF